MRRLHQALLFVALIQINLNVFAYSQLVIFGDSLSDTGNHPAALLGLPYPYYQNRISNGPVAVDVLAKALGLSAANSGHLFGNGNGSNYSVSGANAVGNDPQDLSEQIEAFINRSPATLGRQALYLIMIGGNDVRDASVVDSFAQASTDVIAAVDSIQFGVQRLIQKGARNILISNVPDISKIPETAERALSDPGLFSRAAQLSLDFNLGLKQRIPNLAATPGVKIMLFDFHSRFNQLISYPALYGFTNTNQACFNYDNYQFHPQCNFEKFVFFDSIHPTAKTHSLLGQEMIRVVNSGAKAIPAVLLLLLD